MNKQDERAESTAWDRWIEPFFVGLTRTAFTVALFALVWQDLEREADIPVTVYFVLAGLIIGVRPSDLKALNDLRKKLGS